MNKKLNLISKYKKIYKIILYFLLFIIIIFLVYFSIPKFFKYTPKLIEESLKRNSDFNIKNISDINYRLFPSPRLRFYVSNLELEKNILEVNDSQIDIILNPLSLFKHKRLNYNKILIRDGSTNIRIDKTNQLLEYIKKNTKKFNFKNNSIIFLQENQKLFEINKGIIKINSKNYNQQLSIDGLLLNHKISFFFKNKSKNKSNITFKIPELDIAANISLEKKDKPKIIEGLVNFEIVNNFFQFNFIKKKKTKINKGFVRNNIINSSFKGEVSFRPYFQFNLDIEPSKINIKRLFFIVQKNYFSNDPQGLEIIKKINGFLNFKSMFEGNIIFKNREILFKNFKIGKDNPTFFDANISEFGRKGKIKFNLQKNIQNKNNISKDVKISGFIVPSSSKVNFEQVLVDKEIFNDEKIKKYEKKFQNEVINKSLVNIFDYSKINNFFKNFIN